MKKRQAWINVSSSRQGKCVDAGACDLERALSLLAELDQSDRSRCPTFAQLRDEDEGEQGPDYDHVGFDLYFGDKASASHKNSECCIQVDLLKPTGYNILLTVPRFLLGIIRRPLDSFVQRETLDAAASREQLVTVMQTFFERPATDLFRWVQTQPYLT